MVNDLFLNVTFVGLVISHRTFHFTVITHLNTFTSTVIKCLLSAFSLRQFSAPDAAVRGRLRRSVFFFLPKSTLAWTPRLTLLWFTISSSYSILYKNVNCFFLSFNGLVFVHVCVVVCRPQDVWCWWSALRKEEMDPLFRGSHCHHFLCSSQRLWPGAGWRWRNGKQWIPSFPFHQSLWVCLNIDVVLCFIGLFGELYWLIYSFLSFLCLLNQHAWFVVLQHLLATAWLHRHGSPHPPCCWLVHITSSLGWENVRLSPNTVRKTIV